MRNSSKQKQKLYIKFVKSKNLEDELYKKLKPLLKIIEKDQAKLLFELIRKIQKQYKTMMADLEKKKRKDSEEKLVFTN